RGPWRASRRRPRSGGARPRTSARSRRRPPRLRAGTSPRPTGRAASSAGARGRRPARARRARRRTAARRGRGGRRRSCKLLVEVVAEGEQAGDGRLLVVAQVGEDARIEREGEVACERAAARERARELEPEGALE